MVGNENDGAAVPVGKGPYDFVMLYEGTVYEGIKDETPVDSEGKVTVRVILDVEVKVVSVDDSVQVPVRGLLEKVGVKPVDPGTELVLLKPIGSPTVEEVEVEKPVDKETSEVIVTKEVLLVP